MAPRMCNFDRRGGRKENGSGMEGRGDPERERMTREETLLGINEKLSSFIDFTSSTASRDGSMLR